MKNKDIIRRVLFTLLMFFVYRLGAAITVPGVSVSAIIKGLSDSGFFAMLNLLGGGGLEQFSILALGVSPYITASIVIQLLSMDVIPSLTRLSQEGVQGRKKLDKYTRYLTVVFAFVQSCALVYGFAITYNVLVGGFSLAKLMYIATIFTAGTMFLLWIGDQISMKGIGNGISMIIMAGIVGRLPKQFMAAWQTLVGNTYNQTTLSLFALYVFVFLVIILLVVLINTAERRIPIVSTSSSLALKENSANTYLPLKLNSASVMPVIFASSLMMAPLQIAAFLGQTGFVQGAQYWLGMNTWYSLLIYSALIVFFSFFYSKLQVDPKRIAENLGKSGTYISGVRPGTETYEYINKTLLRLTTVGSLALVIVAILPHLFAIVFPQLPSTIALGGTGMIIVVGVAIEVLKQIKGMKIQNSYKKYYA